MTIAVFGCLFLSSMEISIVSTVAPKIVASLGGMDLFSWIFTAYLLASSLFMPAWGRIADHYGHKKIMLTALVIFLLGSVLCGLSQTMLQLVGARLIQGAGAGALVPISFTILSDLYSYQQRAKLQGLASSVWGISSIIGPLLGGVITENSHWRLVFLINLLPGLPTLWLFARWRPELKTHTPLRISPKSLLSAAMGITSLLLSFALMQKNSFGTALWSLIASCLSFVLFWHYEKTEKHPFIHKEIFNHRIVLAACLTGFLCSGMIIGLASFSPLLFQGVGHYSMTLSGLLISPLSLAWVAGSFFSINMTQHFPYKKLIMTGTLVSLTGLVLFMNAFHHLNTLTIVVMFVLVGLGMAFNYPIVLVTTQHGVPKHLVAFTTSAMIWTRNIGATVATAVMGMVLHFNLKKVGLEGALFFAFMVPVAATGLALFAMRLFPEKIQLRD